MINQTDEKWKLYALTKCFWCGAGKGQKACGVLAALGQEHTGYDEFSSELELVRLPKGAKRIKREPRAV